MCDTVIYRSLQGKTFLFSFGGGYKGEGQIWKDWELSGIFGKKKRAMSVLVKCFIISKSFLASHANTVKG